MKTSLLALTLLVPTLAHAAPGPLALDERPLVLDRGSFEVTEEVSGAVAPHESVEPLRGGPTDLLTFDAGLGRHVQAGLTFTIPLESFSTGFIGALSVIPHLVIGLRPNVAVELQAGFDRTVDELRDTSSNAYLAFGLEARWKLGRFVTLSVGHVGDHMEQHMAMAPGQLGSPLTSVDAYAAETSQALVALEVGRTGTHGSFGVPASITITPHRRVSLRLSAGLRFLVGASYHGGSGYGAYNGPAPVIPVSLDLAIAASRHIDVGARVAVPLLGPDNNDALGTRFVVDSSLFVRARF